MAQRKIISVIFFIMVIMMIGVWIMDIIHGKVPYIDQMSRELVHRLAHTEIYYFFLSVTNLGSKEFVYPFAGIMAIVLIVIYRDWLPGILYFTAICVTHELNGVFKLFIHRERPTILVAANAVGESFPSGHAMVSIVCYGLLAYFLVQKIKSKMISFTIQVFFAFVTFLIGISRYVINVHYLTDVIAGFVFGYMCMVSVIYFFEYIQKKRYPS
ncbi:phosphatase PAP2 family protein [Ornithinibacillus bavariensis]|uniref:phosphatase PAP2 family protein n=1 Tax=Ornithinibacillus bavariensis TaxID=545502 RepID=UPI003D2451E2